MPTRLTFRRPLASAAAAVRARWRRTVQRLSAHGGVSEGNAVRIYSSGDAAFGDMLEAIGNAQRRVWMETYILEPDHLGKRMLAALAAAAARGCEVVLLYDSFGSPNVDDAVLARLREVGGRAVAFNPFWSWRRGIPYYVRDHRKLLVVDDEIAFCGGMNVSDDYAGPVMGNGRMRDTQARIEGPAVRDLAAVFLHSLNEATGENHPVPPSPPPREGGAHVQVLASSSLRSVRSIQRALRHAIQRAAERCYLTTPYFVPPQRLKRAILKAAHRGVDVRILTAGESDVRWVRIASEHIYGRFLQRGVRIFELYDRTLHAKTACIDGMLAMVGSFNLDRWSDRRNLEVAVVIADPRSARDLESQFLDDIERAREVRYATWQRRPWWRRLLSWLAYQVLRL